LLIAKGHLARIRARQHRGKHVVYDYGLLQLAVEDFQKAEGSLPNSADPYLGLARIYYYDEKDYARGADMLNEAAKRGHPIGRREKLQEADALRARALRSLQQADEFSDMPDRQKQYLESARDDFRSAVSLYDQLVDYDPGSTRQIRDTLHRLQGVEGRLQQTTPSFTP
jgi:tetratricopeptide (TPR) repeat protein